MSTQSSAARSVDTGKVPGRRTLRFESLDQLQAEADRLVEAERSGRLRRLGNWTLGQALGHVAGWIEFGYTAYPLKPPFFIRWLLRLQKQKFLFGSMRAGVRIPRVEGGTLATEALPLDEAVTRFRAAVARLNQEAPTAPNPIFGQLTHAESIALTLRHAELHLSFMVPE
jgi:hypothetical protein